MNSHLACLLAERFGVKKLSTQRLEMGCSQSTSTADKGVHSSNGGPRSHTKHDDPLSNDEINKRIDCIKETRTATFGSMTVRYAYLSQRGYYPDGA